MSAAPALPARPRPAREDSIDVQAENDPPPAYEARPVGDHEQTVDMGPSRPFQPPPQQYAAPAAPPPPPTSSSSPLPPPSFPFWNGASLTPAQTGFSDGPTLASYQQQQQQPQHTGSSSNYGAPFQPPFQAPHSTGGGGYTPAPYQAPHPTGYAPPPTSPLQHYAPPPNNPPPLPSRPAPSSSTSTAPPPAQYTPTTKPTPGQPLLRDGKLLVYPSAGHKCSKCGNTGYKPYVERPGTTDPNHPCRKDWDKYSKPFTGALQISTQGTPLSSIPPNYQRPLAARPPPPRLRQQPPPPPPQLWPSQQNPHFNAPIQLSRHPPPGAIVLRPGDPRMGGRLCTRCGGDGLVMGMFIFDEETCGVCNGAGRVF